MAALPYMQLYVADYLADTAHLTTEEHGAYLLLLFNYWQTGKPLRADRLATVARMSNDRWQSVEKTLAEFFNVDVEKGYWMHLRVESDLHQIESKARQASDAGKKSALARALAKQGSQTVAPTDVATDAQRNVNHTDTDTDTDTKIKSPPTPKAKAAKKPKSDFVLPNWINPKAWDDFVGMRKEIKKPLTENAKGLAVKALEKLALQGHNPDTVLNQSTLNSWQGLFEVKNGSGFQTNTGGRGAGRLSAVDQVREANDRAAARRRAEGQAASGSGDLQDTPPPYGFGDFDGEFERIDVTDGKIVGDDGRPIRA